MRPKRCAVPKGATGAFALVDKACGPTAPGISFWPGMRAVKSARAASEERAVRYVAHGPVVA